MSPQLRSSLYVLLVAIIGLVSVYGLVSGEQAEAWTHVAEALVNSRMAELRRKLGLS